MTSERSSHFAWVRVELEDATDDQARYFFEAITGGGATIEREGWEAGIVEVQPDADQAARYQAERRRRDEERRYQGD